MSDSVQCDFRQRDCHGIPCVARPNLPGSCVCDEVKNSGAISHRQARFAFASWFAETAQANYDGDEAKDWTFTPGGVLSNLCSGFSAISIFVQSVNAESSVVSIDQTAVITTHPDSVCKALYVGRVSVVLRDCARSFTGGWNDVAGNSRIDRAAIRPWTRGRNLAARIRARIACSFF